METSVVQVSKFHISFPGSWNLSLFRAPMLYNSYADCSVGHKKFVGSPFQISSLKRPTQQILVLRSRERNSAEKVTSSVKKADTFSLFCFSYSVAVRLVSEAGCFVAVGNTIFCLSLDRQRMPLLIFPLCVRQIYELTSHIEIGIPSVVPCYSIAQETTFCCGNQRFKILLFHLFRGHFNSIHIFKQKFMAVP
jgi:hypothetical protein